MPHVVWRKTAREDVRRITAYIAERNPAAALRHADLFQHCAERLADYPYMYRAGRLPDTREAIVTPNYMLVYRVTTNAIEILAVVHTRQQYP